MRPAPRPPWFPRWRPSSCAWRSRSGAAARGSSWSRTCARCGRSPRRRGTRGPTSARPASWPWRRRTSSSRRASWIKGTISAPATTSTSPIETRASPISSRTESAICRPGPADRDRDGILDDVDKCPDQPEDKDGFEDEDGCPEPDNDKDGLADTSDKCPNEPEDKDKFEDEDGCPDPDNDTDGIADATDKCPIDPEDKDAFEDEDGCPDADNDKDGVLDAADRCPNEPGPPDNEGCPKKFQHIVVTQEKIELKQKIFFDTNKATIQPRSFGLLDEIGSVLKSRPTMTVRIEGHTDSRGKRAHNMQLSQARAESVRQHLVGLGIDSARMEAKGYGPDQPIETNKTVAGREKNRRVEFIITKQ